MNVRLVCRNWAGYFAIARRFSSGGILSMAYLRAVLGITLLFFMT